MVSNNSSQQILRRNRADLRSLSNTPTVQSVVEKKLALYDNPAFLVSVARNEEPTATSPIPNTYSELPTVAQRRSFSDVASTPTPTAPRKSGREVRLPVKFDDYVMGKKVTRPTQEVLGYRLRGPAPRRPDGTYTPSEIR